MSLCDAFVQAGRRDRIERDDGVAPGGTVDGGGGFVGSASNEGADEASSVDPHMGAVADVRKWAMTAT